MEKPRLLLAIVLSVAVYVLFLLLFPAPKRPPRPAAPAPGTAATAPARPVEEPEAPAASGPAIRPLEDAPSEDAVFETAEHRIVLTGKGALAREWRLKGFYADAAVERAGSEDPRDRLDLLRAPASGPAFGLRDHAGALGCDLDAAPWRLSRIEHEGALLARCALSNGLTFEKEFRPGSKPFTLEVVLRLRNESPEAVGRDLLLAFSPAGSIFPSTDGFYADPVAIAAYRQGYDVDAETIVAKANHDEVRPFPAGEVLWAGSFNKYFAVLAVPVAPARIAFARAVPRRDPAAPPAAPYLYLATECGLSFHAKPPGEIEEKRLEIFAGPKRPAAVREAEDSFRALLAKDYGFVSRLVLWVLGLFHGATASWGAAIVLLTFFVRGALFPLNRYQQVSIARFTEKTRKLQPQIEELKKRYKNDFRKFNEAQGRLFKEHGLRPPVFGCLTMFLQLPVWYGLFSALRVSFDLRHAPFLWIDDLSQPDRTVPLGWNLPLMGKTDLNVLPLAMMFVWWLQQRMAPKPADPQQAAQMRILQFLPFVMGFMFFNYAAGLSLYWLVSSTLGILESRIIRRQTGLAVRPTS